MSKFLLALISIALFSSSVFAAVIGQKINNSAFVSYTIGGIDKNKTTNQVTATISKTPAKIEFYSYAPNKNKRNKEINSTKKIVEPTYYFNKDGKAILMQKAILPTGEAVNTPVALPIERTKVYLQNDLIIIKVTDLDQNTNIDTQESIEIEIVNPNTGDREKLILRESGTNSGEFIGFIHGRSKQSLFGDGILALGTNDKITAIYQDNGTSKKVEAKAVVSAVSSRLITSKKANKSTASIGEYIKYTIKVENISTLDIKSVKIEDLLPLGEKFVKGSFKIDGFKTDANLSKDGTTLSYIVPKLGAKSSIELSYIVLIGTGGESELINKAWAITPTAERSNIARAVVKIKDDLNKNKGYILGQVVDIDANSSKKYGVSGVRVYLEDGRYTITDKNGKYHFLDIDNGTHVVQIDTQSFKGRYRAAMCKDNTRFAGSKISQFVELNYGSLARADFCLKRVKKSIAKSQFELSLKKVAKDEVEVTIKVNDNAKSKQLIAILELSEGLEYVKNSTSNDIEAEYRDNLLAVEIDKSKIVSFKLKVLPGAKQNKTVSATLFYDLFNDINLKSDTAIVSFKTGGKLNQEVISIDSGKDIVKSKIAGAKTESYWQKPTAQESMPKYTPQDVAKLGKKPKIIWPPKGWVPNIPSTRFAILLPKGHSVELRLNGSKVDMVHYEGIIRSSNKDMRIIHFKGIDLNEGANRFVAIVKKGKNVIAKLSRDIYVESHAPASVEFLKQYSYLKADGRHSPIIAVRFRGKSGHLLRGGLVGTFKIKGGYEPLRVSNGKAQYKIDSKGIAYIKLKPTTKAGELTLDFGNNLKVTTKLKPYLREWIVVGFAKGTIGYETIKSHLKKGGSDIYHKGRVAFFAKGKVLGKWLLTIAYDSGKSKRELFDAIDPKKYYTIYNDASIQKSEAPSTKKLYLKLEKDDFFALFGDFKTGINGNEFLNYERSFTGLKSKYSKKGFEAALFIAKSSKEFIRDDIRGNGSSGYYYLSKKDIVPGSEQITIEVRDRHHLERILESKTLTRYRDYDIDYQNGTIYFKEPIFSLDKKLNPKYIVAKYEIKGDNSSKYTYGAKLSYKNKKIKTNAIFVKENSGLKDAKLYGANIKIKLNKALDAYLEIAHSKNRIDGKNSNGNSIYAELKYKDINSSAKVYYRKVDKSFGIGQESSIAGASRQIGAEAKRRVNKNISLSAQLYENKNYDTNSSSSTKVLEAKANYENNKTSANIGIRAIKESKSPTAIQIKAGVKKSYLDDNLTISLSHEQTLSGKSSQYPTKSAIGVDYQYSKKTKLFFELERDYNSKTKYLARGGLSYKISKYSTFNYSTQFEDSENENRLYNVYSIDRLFNINKNLKLKLSYERGEELLNNSSSYNAINAVLDYSHKKISSKIKAEYRSGDDKRLNFDSALYYKKSDDISLAFGASYHKSWNKDYTNIYADANLAFAYRPTISNLIILDKIDFIYEKKKDKSSTTKTAKLINNLHLNYKASEKLELGMHYGLKYVSDTIDGINYHSTTDLLGLNAIYDINSKFALGTQASLLHSYTANNYEYGVGVFAEYSPWENSVIRVGYNLSGFRDEDFEMQNIYRSGIYIQFKIKFDQTSFKGLKND